ncbi:hypothetical protein CAPTEDRAFT_58044, partial [Capitella teleta]
PRQPAVRVMLASWWIYCITLGAVYSGNLIAFTTVNIERLPFENLDDVAHQNGYTIGALGGSVYETWFKVSDCRRIFAYNSTDPSVLSADHSFHLRRVLKDKYIYLGDRTTLEDAARKDCRL